MLTLERSTVDDEASDDGSEVNVREELMLSWFYTRDQMRRWRKSRRC